MLGSLSRRTVLATARLGSRPAITPSSLVANHLPFSLFTNTTSPTTATATATATATTTSNVSLSLSPCSSSFTTHPQRVRSYGTGKSNVLTVALWSPGVIIDPYVPEPAGGVPMFFTPAGFRIRLRQLGGFLKSGIAAARIRKALTDFQPDEAPDMAEEMFRLVHLAYEQGDRFSLQQNVTEHLFPELKRGMKKNWALTNTSTVPLRLVGMANRPNIVQMRVLNVDKEDKDKTFAQLTIRVDGEYIDANADTNANAGDVGGVGSEEEVATNTRGNKRSKKKKKRMYVLAPQARGQSDLGEWRAALDNVTGKVYYWHTKTQKRQWNKPSDFGVLSGGSTGSDLIQSNENHNIDEGDTVSLYRSERYIVLERDLYLGAEGRWRICKL
jgi:hypothetical protein